MGWRDVTEIEGEKNMCSRLLSLPCLYSHILDRKYAETWAHMALFLSLKLCLYVHILIWFGCLQCSH